MLSEDIRNAISHKNKLYKKSKFTGTARADMEYYNSKSRLKKMMIQAEKIHFQEIFEKYKGNLQKTWRVIKQLVNHKKDAIKY